MKRFSKYLEQMANEAQHRKLTEFEHGNMDSLDFNQMEKDLKLHKECTAKKCVAGNKHIESCQNEISDTDIHTINNNPF